MRFTVALTAALAASQVSCTTAGGLRPTTKAGTSKYTGPVIISNTAKVISSIASVMSIQSAAEQHVANIPTSSSIAQRPTSSDTKPSTKGSTRKESPSVRMTKAISSTKKVATSGKKVFTGHTTLNSHQSSHTTSTAQSKTTATNGVHESTIVNNTRTAGTSTATTKYLSQKQTASKSNSGVHSTSPSVRTASTSRPKKSSIPHKSTTKPAKTTIKSKSKTTKKTTTRPKAKRDVSMYINSTNVSGMTTPTPTLLTTSSMTTSWSTTSTLNRCDAFPAVYTYVPPDPSVVGFLSDKVFYKTSMTANAPSGFTWLWAAFYSSLSQPGYLGYADLAAYNVSYCSEYCNSLAGCMAFDIYFQRQEGNTPIGCDPKPETIIRCAFYSQSVSYTNLTNIGQWSNGFAVVIAGSNGYSKNTLTNSTSAGP